ncbi:DNA gyrase C-terminal beta-propeller domain-containing protein [Chloroflexota bacterium]
MRDKVFLLLAWGRSTFAPMQPHEKVVVTFSDRGFIKREPSSTYRPQNRGGTGKIGQGTRENDFLRLLTVADTHDDMYFFTNRGKVFRLKCHEIPSGGSRTTKGISVINLLSIAEGEKITAIIATTGLMPDSYLVMATARGEIKRTTVEKYAAVRSSGLITMDLESGDELISACLAMGKDDVILVTRKGKSIKFPVVNIRASSRTSGGVRAIRLAAGDAVVSVSEAAVDAYLLVVSEEGQGKLTPLNMYPRQHRGGVGVKTFNTMAKGEVTAAKVVAQADRLVIIAAEGNIECIEVKDISVQGRGTQGVRIMRLGDGDRVAAVAPLKWTGLGWQSNLQLQ